MHNHIFRSGHAFTRAHKAATRAVARGDLVAADKWLRLAERHERLALRLYKLEDAQLDVDVMTEHARTQMRRLRRLQQTRPQA